MGRWGGAGVHPRRVAPRPPLSASSPRERALRHSRAQLLSGHLRRHSHLDHHSFAHPQYCAKVACPHHHVSHLCDSHVKVVGTWWGGWACQPRPCPPPMTSQPGGVPGSEASQVALARPPPIPQGGGIGLCSPSPLDPLQVLALDPRSPRPQERPMNSLDLVLEAQEWPVACVLCCLAPRWPSLPLTLRTGAQPGRGRWRQGLRGCPTPSPPQRPSSGPWGAGDELATGEQGQGLPSSPGHGAGAASSGQCCCAFKDRHVMRGQWSPASHCPLPQAGPLVTLGFDYFISNAILAVGTRFPQNCSRAVFTEIKARTDPGSGTLPHGSSSLRPLLRF